MFFIVPRYGVQFEPGQKKAMVTIAIGENYYDQWMGTPKSMFLYYAEKHGYDVILITSNLDPYADKYNRSVAWQKCLILSQPWSSHYERIVWVDADILINNNAPDIIENIPVEKVGAVLLDAQRSLAESQIHLEQMMEKELIPRLPLKTKQDIEKVNALLNNQVYTRQNGIKTDEIRMISTGVMVLSPQHHRFVLEECYRYPQRDMAYEQHPLSYLIFKNNLFEELNPRFNWHIQLILNMHLPSFCEPLNFSIVHIHEMVINQYKNAYFLHFAGVGVLLRFFLKLLELQQVK